MAHVEDRWIRKDRTRTARYGTGKRYRVIWAGGSKSFTTKDAARGFLEDLESRERGYTPARGVLVGDYAEQWMNRQIHQRASSREQIDRKLRNHIIPALGGYRLDQVTRVDVQDAVIRWAETLAPSTVKLTYTYLSGMMKSAVLDGLIRVSPCVGVRLPRREPERVRPLSTDMVQSIVDHIWTPYKPLVVLGAATGLRGAELRGLTWDRVNLEAGSITVDRQLLSAGVWGPPKTPSSVRTVSVGPSTVDTLKNVGQDGPLVFHNKGAALSRNAAGEAWRHVRGILPGIGDGFHQLRHYHASQLIAGGMSPVAVAHRLGHKDANETLSTYAHLWHDDDARAATITDGLVGCSVGVTGTPRPP